ncbi:MAG: Fe-S cluster assembly protein SufD [Pirellulaceae bacterium]|nr:Fe-S cluster assembly protein SufD [Pirellulaceae bacterium]
MSDKTTAAPAAHLTAFSAESFEAFVQGRNEPAWLRDQRWAAWQDFCTLDWPGRRDEEWMRTDIRLFKLEKYGLPVESQPWPEAPPALLGAGVDLAGFSLAINSHPATEQLGEEWAARGVLFGSLDRLVREHGDLLRPWLLRRVVNPRADKFAALHAACWSGGHVLYVPRGVVVDRPFLAHSCLGSGQVDLGHTLVILEEGAEATVLSEMSSPAATDGGLHCGAVELLLSPGSHLRYVSLQEWGKDVWHFAHHKALVERDASLQWTVAALGGRLSKVNQHVGLIGAGANCQVNGVMFAEDRQHVSYHTLQHHQAPYCKSDFLYKAALQDKSRTVWRGMIKVDHDAQRTDGYQRNDNLLLSDRARADSIPGLEIEADDVRCTHGSTTGRVDDEQLFYARCRGFTSHEAAQMIVTGFFQQVFDRITIESVREALGHAIALRVRQYE